MRGLADFASTWLLWAFALFGAISALGTMVRLVRRVRSSTLPGVSLAVLVQNQEHQAEGFVRLLTGILRRAPWVSCQCQLLVLDLASTDSTAYILDRLVRQNPAIRVLHLATEQAESHYAIVQQECSAPVMISLDLRAGHDAGTLVTALDKLW